MILVKCPSCDKYHEFAHILNTASYKDADVFLFFYEALEQISMMDTIPDALKKESSKMVFEPIMGDKVVQKQKAKAFPEIEEITDVRLQLLLLNMMSPDHVDVFYADGDFHVLSSKSKTIDYGSYFEILDKINFFIAMMIDANESMNSVDEDDDDEEYEDDDFSGPHLGALRFSLN